MCTQWEIVYWDMYSVFCILLQCSNRPNHSKSIYFSMVLIDDAPHIRWIWRAVWLISHCLNCNNSPNESLSLFFFFCALFIFLPFLCECSRLKVEWFWINFANRENGGEREILNSMLMLNDENQTQYSPWMQSNR